MSHKVWAQI